MNWIKTLLNRVGFPSKPNKAGFYPSLSINGKAQCPQCGCIEFYFGPEGGAAQNLQCKRCLSFWNYMGPFGFQRISDRSAIFGVTPPPSYETHK